MTMYLILIKRNPEQIKQKKKRKRDSRNAGNGQIDDDEEGEEYI